MDGVELPKAWQTYLPLEDDYSDAAALATLGWVRQSLIGEALAAQRPDLIGLFRRDPRRVRARSLPSLGAFAEGIADASEFSEAELLALWQEQHGQPSPAEARRDRLARRLREALDLLELGVRRHPAASDAVGRWLAPHLAQRLADAGLPTLGRVAEALPARRSPRWHEVPGIGVVGADRLAAWLDEHGLLPAPPATSAPRPALLDSLAADLSGAAPEANRLPAAAGVDVGRWGPLSSAGSLSPSGLPGAFSDVTALPRTAGATSAGNQLGAQDDRHAIALWLQARASNAHTHRAYRKTAERLLLWCRHERRIGLADMTVADCMHYRQWLQTLGRLPTTDWVTAGWRIPADQWIAKHRAIRRDSADWRPFDGPLSPDSAAQDMLVIKALFSFLLKAGYLAHQPWDLLGRTPRAASRLGDASEQFTERSLDARQWAWLIDGLNPGAGDLQARLAAVLWLGYACGLRAAEMLSLTLGSLQARASGWRLRVLGKGGKARTVPLPSPARDAVLVYLAQVGLGLAEVLRISGLPSSDPETLQPLLRAQRGRRRPGREAPFSPLRYSTLHTSLKAYLALRADDLGAQDPVACVKLRQASTHWLRHTCATLALQSGVPINAVQRVLGHASLQTTSHYLTAQQEALQTAMEGFASGGQPTR